MTARVREVRCGSTVAAVMLPVTASTSAKTGSAPTYRTAFVVAMNENDGTTTSSPGPIPATCSARCSAVVQDDTATAYGDCMRAANVSSNSLTRGPCATQPERRTSVTAATSSSPSHGCMTLMRSTSDRPAQLGVGLPLDQPPVDEAVQPLVQADRGGPAQVVAGSRGRRQTPGNAVHLAGRSELDGQVRTHRPQQRLGQAAQGGLLLAGDVVHAFGHVRGGRQQVGVCDVGGEDEVHGLRPVAEDQGRLPGRDPLHPPDQHLGVEAVDVHARAVHVEVAPVSYTH